MREPALDLTRDLSTTMQAAGTPLTREDAAEVTQKIPKIENICIAPDDQSRAVDCEMERVGWSIA